MTADHGCWSLCSKEMVAMGRQQEKRENGVQLLRLSWGFCFAPVSTGQRQKNWQQFLGIPLKIANFCSIFWKQYDNWINTWVALLSFGFQRWPVFKCYVRRKVLFHVAPVWGKSYCSILFWTAAFIASQIITEKNILLNNETWVKGISSLLMNCILYI